MAMSMDMKAGAAALGVSDAVFRFLVCFLASLPCNALLYFVPGAFLRHGYAFLTGFTIVHLSFGREASVFVLLPVLFTFATMMATRRYCGTITFCGTFGFLIYSHVAFMSGDQWKEGGMDFTGALMVMTLKLTSCAMNYQDGAEDKYKLYDSHARNSLAKMPSLLEFLSYSYCCGTVLVGPVYEMKDYLAFIERREVWSEKAEKHFPSPYFAAAKAFVRSIFCLLVYLWLTPLTPWSRLSDPEFLSGPFFKKWGYIYLVVFTVRWKYYFIWSLSETACCLSGFGFTGWEILKDGTRQALWTRAKNVDIVPFELARGGAAAFPRYWNITVSSWLREYVYLRLVPKGKKPGFWPLLITQIVSAIWHGLYPGYVVFFAGTAIMIAGSRVIHTYLRAIPPRRWVLRAVASILQSAYAILVLTYAVFGFLFLSLDETLAIYHEMHYIGTIIPIVLIFLGMVVRPPKPSGNAVVKED